MRRILILCTGNSCRSQMAEGVLRSLDSGFEVCSAGTEPAEYVHPKAVQVMKEIGIDISRQAPAHIKRFLDTDFEYVITVCGGAREACPIFTGRVRRRMHTGFDDPVKATGTEEEVLCEFRRIRDEIKKRFLQIYLNDIIA